MLRRWKVCGRRIRRRSCRELDLGDELLRLEGFWWWLKDCGDCRLCAMANILVLDMQGRLPHRRILIVSRA